MVFYAPRVFGLRRVLILTAGLLRLVGVLNMSFGGCSESYGGNGKYITYYVRKNMTLFSAKDAY